MTRQPVRILLAIGAILLGAHLVAAEVLRKPDGRVVFGDATHHFVQLRSLVFDRDLHFENEYRRIYGLQGEVGGLEWVTSAHTVTGHVRNYMPVGPALLWMPLYVLAAIGQWILSWTGAVASPDGYGRALQLVPGVTGILAATGAALLSWRIARTRVGETYALSATVAIWLGTHAVYYSLVSPAYSHTASMLAAGVFFAYWLDTRPTPSVRRIAGWGALAGVAALMRWQDAVLLAIPLIEAARWSTTVPTRVSAGLAAIAAFFAAFSPQMAVWAVLYGQPLAIPQGAAFMQWWSPHPLAVLFSDNHGLLTWAPLLVPALLGLAALLRREPAIRLPLVVVVLLSWYTNAAVADWWAGEAFGARRFLSLFPLFVLGLAWWLKEPGGPARTPGRHGLVMVLCIANWLLLLQYQLFMKGLVSVAPYPQGWFDLFLARLVVPFRLFSWWWG